MFIIIHYRQPNSSPCTMRKLIVLQASKTHVSNQRKTRAERTSRFLHSPLHHNGNVISPSDRASNDRPLNGYNLLHAEGKARNGHNTMHYQNCPPVRSWYSTNPNAQDRHSHTDLPRFIPTYLPLTSMEISD